MADVFTRAKRSAVMARIRGQGNRDTELRLIALMRTVGFVGWRRGVTLRLKVEDGKPKPKTSAPKAPSALSRSSDDQSRSPFRSRTESGEAVTSTVLIRPDFVFPRQRLAVFVDGCFFHGCPKHATWPKNNAAFWRAKIRGNMTRDRLQARLLRKHGWSVLRIWEHALTPKNAARTLARLQRALGSGRHK